MKLYYNRVVSNAVCNFLHRRLTEEMNDSRQDETTSQ